MHLYPRSASAAAEIATILHDSRPLSCALDPATGRLFFGSMRNGGIYVLDDAGRLSRFADIDDPPGFSAVGAERELLGSIGTSSSFAEDFDPNATIRTGVFGFDLETGEAVTRHLADPSVEAFNDVTVAPNGDIYLSGSVLSVIRAASGEISPLQTAPSLAGTNGIVASPDGRMLFVSVYPLGIASVDVASGAARILDVPERETLYGVDGLYWHDGELVAIQNGTNPWRLLRIGLDERHATVTGIRVIEFANAELTATTGAVSGDEILYIGQGPAPDTAPGHVPEQLLPFFGKAIIMAAPLD